MCKSQDAPLNLTALTTTERPIDLGVDQIVPHILKQFVCALTLGTFGPGTFICPQCEYCGDERTRE